MLFSIFGKRERAGYILTLVFLIAGCSEDNSTPMAGVEGDENLVEIVETVRKNNNLPAMGVMVADELDMLEYAASGYREFSENVHVSNEDQWQLGSLGKAITATLAARMVEAGLVSWNTTIGEVFGSLEENIHPRYWDVTLAMLLRHQSGMERGGNIPDKYLVSQDRLDFVLNELQDKPIHKQDEFNYSNFGYVTAGELLSQVGGSSWEDLLDEYVLAPLNISEWGVGVPAKTNNLDQPVGHVRRSFDQSGRVNDAWLSVGAPDKDEPTWKFFGAAGGVFMSMSEYAKFVSMHLAGARGDESFLSQESFDFLHRPYSKDDYAMGWITLDEDELDGLDLMNGDLALTHSGTNLSFTTLVMMLPDFDRAIFIVSNSGGANTFLSMYNEVLPVILERHNVTGAKSTNTQAGQ